MTDAAEPADAQTHDAAPDPRMDRDRTTVRRALRAGLIAGVAVMLLLVPALLSDNSPGGAVMLAAGIAAATLVTAAWLLLAGILDTIAGVRLSLRRALWTAGATVAALFGPFLLLGTLAQAAAGGGA